MCNYVNFCMFAHIIFIHYIYVASIYIETFNALLNHHAYSTIIGIANYVASYVAIYIAMVFSVKHITCLHYA